MDVGEWNNGGRLCAVALHGACVLLRGLVAVGPRGVCRQRSYPRLVCAVLAAFAARLAWGRGAHLLVALLVAGIPCWERSAPVPFMGPGGGIWRLTRCMHRSRSWHCLALAWLCRLGTTFDRRVLARAWQRLAHEVVVRIARVLLVIKALVRLQRAKRIVNRALKRFGLPRLSRTLVKLPSASHISLARCLWRLVTTAAPVSPVLMRWVRLQVKFIG